MEMKENIKIGLIGIIALTLIVNTFFTDNGPSRYASSDNDAAQQSNIAASPITNVNNLNPINASPNPQTITPPPAQPSTAGQLSQTRAKTGVKFAEMNHSFGQINQDSKNTKIFTFTNTGTEPLIIENATGSCGCTVPKFPKEPIKPGGTGEIEVVYSPGKQQGAQNKTVTITANTDPIATVLNISADVQVVAQ
jgi:Protein of unknown function (DUF1573)